MITSYPAEKLNMWDRLFNRKKKIVAARGTEGWSRITNSNFYWEPHRHVNYQRQFVEYHIIDRLTGAYTVEKDYLN